MEELPAGAHEVEEPLEKVLGNEEELPLLVSLLPPSISLLYKGKNLYQMNNQKHPPASVCELKVPVKTFQVSPKFRQIVA